MTWPPRATTTRLLYDGAALIGEYDTSGTLLRRYVHGPGIDEPIVWYEGSGTSDRRWLVGDELGSIVAVTNGSGAASTINTYDEYGRPGSANAGRFQYTGQTWLAEVALYHYRARVYAPAIGRFLQTDPILYDGGMNLYAYVGNDPVNWIDPWGLQKDDEYVIVLGVRRQCEPDCPLQVNIGIFDLPQVAVGTDGIPITAEIEVTALRCTTVECQQRRFDRLMNNVDHVRLLGEFVYILAGDPDPTDPLTYLTLGRGGLLGRVCGCFEEGTMVATPDGLRRIEEIEVGDYVLAWNEETGEVAPQRVTALIRPEPKLLWRLEVRDADGEVETFHVTDDHPWYVEGSGWVETQHLAAGQRIETADDRGLTILDIARTDRVERTYNLEVEGWHTFLVGEDGAVVHNQVCPLVGHHPWPKYLGGAAQHNLYMTSARLHNLFHAGLDRLASRFAGARQLTPELGGQMANYMARFDAQHGTAMLRAARANGFPY